MLFGVVHVQGSAIRQPHLRCLVEGNRKEISLMIGEPLLMSLAEIVPVIPPTALVSRARRVRVHPRRFPPRSAWVRGR